MKTLMKLTASIVAIALIFGCSQQEEQVVKLHDAVKIEQGDECHLCGMIISNFAGPKGELFRKDVTAAQSNAVKKFCSTRDMFSFYLDPENKRNVTTILVHDMSKSPWDEPNDDYFINAREAWFVTGSSKRGAMGATLASFSTQHAAQTFAKEFGGKVLSFEQVNLDAIM